MGGLSAIVFAVSVVDSNKSKDKKVEDEQGPLDTDSDALMEIPPTFAPSGMSVSLATAKSDGINETCAESIAWGESREYVTVMFALADAVWSERVTR
jgi:hypothetical protein